MIEQGPTFTPSEVAQLTGVSTTQQRDWRRHGFMPETPPGWARYRVADLCRLRLFRLFATQGIAPGASLDAVDRLAPEFAERCLAIIYHQSAEGSGADRVAVIWATREITTHASLQAAFDRATPAQQEGPCVVLDLNTIATPFGIELRKWVDAKIEEIDQPGELIG